MSSGKNLGIFWENNAFCIVESQHDVPQKVFRVPHQPAPELDPVSPILNVDDVRFVAPLKAALQANNIKTTDVNLVLPSKDIIIRSFVVPFLKPSEIRSVVEFEIKKYIPFNIKDMSFNFHAVTFVEDKVKRMRIYFVAIRKEISERYKLILKQAGLNVVYSEPAAMCMARVLIHKKVIKSDQRVAVIYSDFNDPGIMVINKGVVQFVRDFQLQNPTLNLAPLDIEMLKKKLFNEIKISLDFYLRQYKSEKLEEMLNLSFIAEQDLSSQLQAELEVPVKKINLPSLGKYPVTPDTGILAAHGINLRGVTKTVDFNLSGIIASPTQASKLKEQVPEEYIPVVKVGVVCAALLAVIFVLTNMNIAQYKKRYDAIVELQGAFVEMLPEDIQARITDNRNKLSSYRKVFQPSQMAFVMSYIAQMLPKGMWLTELDVKYVKDKEGMDITATNTTNATTGVTSQEQAEFNPMILELSGYAYIEDPNEQFKMVYAFLNTLKADKILKKYTRSINLTGIQSEQKGEVSLTSFKILAR